MLTKLCNLGQDASSPSLRFSLYKMKITVSLCLFQGSNKIMHTKHLAEKLPPKEIIRKLQVRGWAAACREECRVCLRKALTVACVLKSSAMRQHELHSARNLNVACFRAGSYKWAIEQIVCQRGVLNKRTQRKVHTFLEALSGKAKGYSCFFYAHQTEQVKS